MQATPTGGTWHYERAFGRVMSDAPTPDGDAMPIADVSAAFKSLEETHANGRLLAAAPALLAACETALACYAEFARSRMLSEEALAEMETIRAALKKAKGVS